MKLITALFTGSIFMFLVVLFRASDSHALKARLTPDALQSYMIAIRYMLFHGVAILALVSLPFLDEASKGRIAFLLVAGVIVFSGSIMVLSTKAMHQLNLSWLGPVTPLGGLLLLAGWGYLIFLLGKQLTV